MENSTYQDADLPDERPHFESHALVGNDQSKRIRCHVDSSLRAATRSVLVDFRGCSPQPFSQLHWPGHLSLASIASAGATAKP